MSSETEVSAEDDRGSYDAVESAVRDVEIELTVVLGKSIMPISNLLKMGRGAIIELETYVDDDVWMMANDRMICRCQVMMSGDRLAIEITEPINLAGIIT